DAVAAVANEYGANARAVSAGLSRRRAARPDRRALFAGFGAVAAAAAVAVVMAPQLSGPKTQTFVTAKGEHRSVNLADGSKLDLNAGTRLTVTLGRDARRVTLDEGQ